MSQSEEKKRRGRPKRNPIAVEQLTGRKYLRLLEPYLERLNKAYAHPNRVLFYDDVLLAHLMAFFNPAVRSLRTIEDASQIPAINEFFNVQAVRKSTLSQANALFDPIVAQGLIAELRRQLPSSCVGGDADEKQLRRLLDTAILVDGSFFRLAADVAWAIHAANQYGGGDDANQPGIGMVRLNLQYCLSSGVPIGVSINGADHMHESTAARAFIEPGRLSLFDNGVVSFDSLRDILQASSHLVCNLSPGVKFEGEKQKDVSPQDILPILEVRERERALARARQARKKAAEKSA